MTETTNKADAVGVGVGERTELSERAPAKRIDEILTQPYVVLKAGRINYEVRRDFLQLATEVKHLRLDLAEATKPPPRPVDAVDDMTLLNALDAEAIYIEPENDDGFSSGTRMVTLPDAIKALHPYLTQSVKPVSLDNKIEVEPTEGK